LPRLERHAQNWKSGKFIVIIRRPHAIGASAVRARRAAGAPPLGMIDAGLARIDRGALLARRSLFDK